MDTETERASERGREGRRSAEETRRKQARDPAGAALFEEAGHPRAVPRAGTADHLLLAVVHPLYGESMGWVPHGVECPTLAPRAPCAPLDSASPSFAA